MFPPAPVLGTLRLARLADLTRLGVVAAAGFYHSSMWSYERPFAADYVNDTLASYRNMYQRGIVDPNIIVLVAEDHLNKAEVESVYGPLADVYPSWSDQLPPDSLKDGKAIVGITSLSLQSGSARKGQFLPDGTYPRGNQHERTLTDMRPGNPDIPADPELRNRDKNPVAGKLMENATHDVAERLVYSDPCFRPRKLTRVGCSPSA
jgi:hypothetical protein